MTKNIFRAMLGIIATAVFASSAFAGSTNLLMDPSFDVLDTSGGDVQCDAAASWGCFNNAFFSSQAIAPRSGANAAKAWGGDAGIQQSVNGITAGTTYEASAYAANWNGDFFNNLALVQLTFWDGADATGNQVGGAFEAFCGGPASGQACILNGVDGGSPDMWTLMSVSGVAPTGAVSANFLLLHIDIGLGGGSIFWDDASLTAQVVPIPGALLLMGPALLGLMGIRRKRA